MTDVTDVTDATERYPEPEPLNADEIAANRATWVDALHSGEYDQAHGKLRIGNAYCCLGVAERERGCEWRQSTTVEVFAVPDRRVILTDPWTRQRATTGDDNDPAANVLSSHAQHWLGLLETDPYVVYRPFARNELGYWWIDTLTTLNDTKGFTLRQIGDVIADQPVEWNGTFNFAAAERRRRDALALNTSEPEDQL